MNNHINSLFSREEGIKSAATLPYPEETAYKLFMLSGSESLQKISNKHFWMFIPCNLVILFMISAD